MSPVLAPVSLTDQQATTILTEAASRGLFERDLDGQLPRTAEDRLTAASSLVDQARLAHAAGNRSDDVISVLFIAEVDLRPETQPQGEQMSSAPTDLASVSDEMLRKFHTSLSNYPQSEEVEGELAQIRAEMERRKMTVEGTQEGNGRAAPTEEPAAAPQASSGDDQAIRAELENRLTFSIMRAHGIDPSEVPQLSVETLEWVIAHPEGGEAQPPVQAQPEPEVSPMGDPEQARVTIETPSAPQDPSSAATPDGVTPEREALEAQVTGPTLKAYGRGRKEIPSIGSHELAFMVANPDGRVTREALLAERAKDEGTPAPEPEPQQQATVAEQEREQAQTTADSAFSPPVEGDEKEAPQSAPELTPPTPPQVERGSDRADEIIANERLPVALDFAGDPPHLPNDVSKVSDEELFSLHARIHACETRVNWLITLREGEVTDLEKLLRHRRREVHSSIPKVHEGKRLTKDAIETLVESDTEVCALTDRISDIEKGTRKLRTLRENYRSDVAVCSRQYSMRSGELKGIPK